MLLYIQGHDDYRTQIAMHYIIIHIDTDTCMQAR